MPPPPYFPLRWESTGDQWWYASPIDWAAANGHYDLVREFLRLDGNNLIKLTSLRRIRRLETVWDDEEQFDDVAKCRSQVARKLLIECESKKGKNSLIRGGYGGWLLYTAASAGDLGFVQEMLDKDPLLVFGEGEFGVTDILYAAARSKDSEVFSLVFNFAVSPRFVASRGGEIEEQIEEVPSGFRWEMINRAVHAASRGGNLKVLKEILGDSSDILAYRDNQGSTILHAAAGKGQVEVVKYLIASYDIITATDHRGNTALHVAAYRGKLPVVEALILASPSSISSTNNHGDTFLHRAIFGLQTPGFQRLDRQVDLMKQLVSGEIVNLDNVINAKNNDGRTALHLAIIGNIHSDLVERLMTVRSLNVNIRDLNGMTPLDLLKQRPRSASSEILIKRLISVGGNFSQDYTARKAVASQMKMQGFGNSPGTSFRIPDAEIFLYTGIEASSDVSFGQGSYSTAPSHHHDSSNENIFLSAHKKTFSGNNAAGRLKILLHLPQTKENKDPEKLTKPVDEPPTPLRQRFSKPPSLPNNKRTLSVRSNLPSPSNKKKLASGLMHGVMQAMPHLAGPSPSPSPHHTPSNSISKSSVSSLCSLDKQKGVCIESDVAGPSGSTGPSGSNQVCDDDDETPKLTEKNKRLMRRYLCFGGRGRVNGHQAHLNYKQTVISSA